MVSETAVWTIIAISASLVFGMVSIIAFFSWNVYRDSRALGERMMDVERALRSDFSKIADELRTAQLDIATIRPVVTQFEALGRQDLYQFDPSSDLPEGDDVQKLRWLVSKHTLGRLSRTEEALLRMLISKEDEEMGRADLEDVVKAATVVVGMMPIVDEFAEALRKASPRPLPGRAIPDYPGTARKDRPEGEGKEEG